MPVARVLHRGEGAADRERVLLPRTRQDGVDRLSGMLPRVRLRCHEPAARLARFTTTATTTLSRPAAVALRALAKALQRWRA